MEEVGKERLVHVRPHSDEVLCVELHYGPENVSQVRPECLLCPLFLVQFLDLLLVYLCCLGLLCLLCGSGCSPLSGLLEVMVHLLADRADLLASDDVRSGSVETSLHPHRLCTEELDVLFFVHALEKRRDGRPREFLEHHLGVAGCLRSGSALEAGDEEGDAVDGLVLHVLAQAERQKLVDCLTDVTDELDHLGVENLEEAHDDVQGLAHLLNHGGLQSNTRLLVEEHECHVLALLCRRVLHVGGFRVQSSQERLEDSWDEGKEVVPHHTATSLESLRDELTQRIVILEPCLLQ
mmetsp:Transcript_52342/g.102456  ORF Transcript_52342/g.102456 Transcript_52342/m.102456 type:complete len:294 (+) Transcript_52342:844-1725(+)